MTKNLTRESPTSIPSDQTRSPTPKTRGRNAAARRGVQRRKPNQRRYVIVHFSTEATSCLGYLRPYEL